MKKNCEEIRGLILILLHWIKAFFMVKSVWKGFVTKYSSDIRIAAKEDRIYVLKGGGGGIIKKSVTSR